MPKKVLIITYYFPPAGGSGVQRPLKFVKYLREFGWEPVVFTSEGGEYPNLDPTLLDDVPEGIEVIRKKILEPYSLFKKLSGKDKKEKVDPNTFKNLAKSTWLSQFILWIRSNLFFPDARMLWIRPSVKYLTQYLKTHPVDVIISTGPPHTIHLIGYHVHRHTGIPWMAEFRDPWTKIEYFPDLKLTAAMRRKHFRWEKKVVTESQVCLTVAPGVKADFEARYGVNCPLITNGFDEEDFAHKTTVALDEKFTIVHTGTFRSTQNHPIFWQALAELKQEIPAFSQDLEVRFYGATDKQVQDMADAHGLTDNLKLMPYIPHKDIINVQMSARLLFIVINILEDPRMVIAGKIFEYMVARRPMLGIAPRDGDTASLIYETQSGTCAGFEEKDMLKGQIKDWYERYKAGDPCVPTADISHYSRRNLTKRLAQVLDGMIIKQ